VTPLAADDVLRRLRSSEYAVFCPCLDLRKAAAHEIEQLRKDVAINTINAATVLRLEHRLDRIHKLAAADTSGCGACRAIVEECEHSRVDVPEKCPDGLLPDGEVCPRCKGRRGPSGIGGGTWVHY
jgi:hypothetical protein